jgi:hypothetical protein
MMAHIFHPADMSNRGFSGGFRWDPEGRYLLAGARRRGSSKKFSRNVRGVGSLLTILFASIAARRVRRERVVLGSVAAAITSWSRVSKSSSRPSRDHR